MEWYLRQHTWSMSQQEMSEWSVCEWICWALQWWMILIELGNKRSLSSGFNQSSFNWVIWLQWERRKSLRHTRVMEARTKLIHTHCVCSRNTQQFPHLCTGQLHKVCFSFCYRPTFEEHNLTSANCYSFPFISLLKKHILTCHPFYRWRLTFKSWLCPVLSENC